MFGLVVKYKEKIGISLYNDMKFYFEDETKILDLSNCEILNTTTKEIDFYIYKFVSKKYGYQTYVLWHKLRNGYKEYCKEDLKLNGETYNVVDTIQPNGKTLIDKLDPSRKFHLNKSTNDLKLFTAPSRGDCKKRTSYLLYKKKVYYVDILNGSYFITGYGHHKSAPLKKYLLEIKEKEKKLIHVNFKEKRRM